MIELKTDMTMAEIITAERENSRRRAAALSAMRKGIKSAEEASSIIQSCDRLAKAYEKEKHRIV